MLDVLILSPWLPWPPHDGARIRILETVRFLAARHRVHLMTTLYAPEEQAHVGAVGKHCGGIETVTVGDGATARAGRLIRGLAAGVPAVQSYHRNDAMLGAIRRVTHERRFDVVHVEFSFLAHYLGALSPECRARRILSTHNIETERFERELAHAPWNARRVALSIDRYAFRDWERRAARAFDGITAVSDEDRAWFERHAPGIPTALVPNGVDVDFFRPQEVARAETVVFTGAMNYPPNVDAVLWFAEAILPRLRERRPDLGFTIVGSRPLPEVEALARLPGVRVTGRVEDIRPYIAEALAFVVPLRSGGGTRLKILQAMAMAAAVISTSLGAEGLEVTDGDDILIADEPDAFADRVLAVADSPALASRLGEAGRALTLARYDWQKCLLELERLYERVLGAAAR